jgi:hypothetical protein
MKLNCPACEHAVPVERDPRCSKCGADLSVLRQIMHSASDSVRLALESMREGRYKDALDYAYEAWGLVHTPETAAMGLLAAVQADDGTEVTRWLRRRMKMCGEPEDMDQDES